MMVLRSAIEQSYQDNSEYPSIKDFQKSISPYMSKIPRDPK